MAKKKGLFSWLGLGGSKDKAQDEQEQIEAVAEEKDVESVQETLETEQATPDNVLPEPEPEPVPLN